MLPKEIESPYSELVGLAEGLTHTFIQRFDLYARQLDDGRYVCIQKSIKPGHILAHLRGDLTLGTYALDNESRTRFLVFDADDEYRFGMLVDLANRLTDQGATSYLETSRRGGHLWLFFSQAISGKDVRRFGAGLAASHGLEGIEMFPKQDHLNGGPGSLIRLPFGIHRKTGKRYGFLGTDLQSLANTIPEQVRLLCQPMAIAPEIFSAYRSFQKADVKINKKIVPRSEPDGITLSERIKSAVSVYDFVSQYVELSPAGLGLCPFHDDHHPSFAVKSKENYWHCFAGCGGGSIIDFWMKRRNCDFTTAVRELAEILL